MNIICNNCVGARLYEVTKQQFPNPFMWMSISTDDYIKLIENYDNIDLSNPSFELEYYGNNDYQTILVKLDYDIKLHYIHYIQDNDKENPVKELNTNILYKDILKYAKIKWFNRLNRNKECPTFIYSFNYANPKTISYLTDLNKLLNIKTKYELIILVHENIKLNKNINHIKLLNCDNSIMELNGGALANKLKNIIFK